MVQKVWCPKSQRPRWPHERFKNKLKTCAIAKSNLKRVKMKLRLRQFQTNKSATSSWRLQATSLRSGRSHEAGIETNSTIKIFYIWLVTVPNSHRKALARNLTDNLLELPLARRWIIISRKERRFFRSIWTVKVNTLKAGPPLAQKPLPIYQTQVRQSIIQTRQHKKLLSCRQRPTSIDWNHLQRSIGRISHSWKTLRAKPHRAWRPTHKITSPCKNCARRRT